MKKDYSAANVVENTQLARTFETLSFEWVSCGQQHRLVEHPKKLKTQTTISHLLTFTSDPFLYNILMVAGADELMGNSSTKTWYFEWTMMLQKTNIHV